MSAAVDVLRASMSPYFPEAFTEQPCPSCAGSGRLPHGVHTVTCGRCIGQGTVWARTVAVAS